MRISPIPVINWVNYLNACDISTIRWASSAMACPCTKYGTPPGSHRKAPFSARCLYVHIPGNAMKGHGSISPGTDWCPEWEVGNAPHLLVVGSSVLRHSPPKWQSPSAGSPRCVGHVGMLGVPASAKFPASEARSRQG